MRLISDIGFNRRQVGIWLVALVIFVFHQCCQKIFDLSFYVADYYLDPFLLPMIAMPLMLAECRMLLGQRHFYFPVPQLMGIVVLFCLVSEIIFPAINAGFTADFSDVCMICCGSLIFHWVFGQQRMSSSNTKLLRTE